MEEHFSARQVGESHFAGMIFAPSVRGRRLTGVDYEWTWRSQQIA